MKIHMKKKKNLKKEYTSKVNCIKRKKTFKLKNWKMK